MGVLLCSCSHAALQILIMLPEAQQETQSSIGYGLLPGHTAHATATIPTCTPALTVGDSPTGKAALH